MLIWCVRVGLRRFLVGGVERFDLVFLCVDWSVLWTGDVSYYVSSVSGFEWSLVDSLSLVVLCGSASPAYGSGSSWSSLCNWTAVLYSLLMGSVISSPDSSYLVEVEDCWCAPDTWSSVDCAAEASDVTAVDLASGWSLTGSPGVSMGVVVVSAVVVECLD